MRVDPVSRHVCPKKDELFLRTAVLHTGKFKETIRRFGGNEPCELLLSLYELDFSNYLVDY